MLKTIFKLVVAYYVIKWVLKDTELGDRVHDKIKEAIEKVVG